MLPGAIRCLPPAAVWQQRAAYNIVATGPAANYVYGVTSTANQVLLNVSFVNRLWTRRYQRHLGPHDRQLVTGPL